MFDIDVDLKADDMAGSNPDALRRSTHRSRFPPCQVKAEAYTREIDESISNTQLQHGLKTHPSAQAWKAQVCLSFLSHLPIHHLYMC